MNEQQHQQWQVTLFGGLRAQRGEPQHAGRQHTDKQQQVITRFRTQKVASLFAYLAFHLRQAHSREILLEMLWPESEAPAQRNGLSVALSSLRHQFEPPGTPQGAVIRADRFSVGLNSESVTTDVQEFEQAIRAAAKAQSITERAQYLTSAVELYQGPLLPGFYEEWITGEQQRLSGLFFDAVGALINHLESIGDTRVALAHARHAVAADPLREDGQQHLIRLLAADGQAGAALRQYKEYERLLEEETADEPSAALRSLYRRIERESGLTAAPAPPNSPPVVPAPSSRAVRSSSSASAPATMTFLMSDIEGSTRLFQQTPQAYSAARERHNILLRQEFTRHGGQEIKETGDGFVVAFPTAGSALACAVATQKALAEELWPQEIGSLRVRMALHTGDVEHSSGGHGDYQGLVLHHTSRMLTAAHGGQILVSEATAALLSSRSIPEEAGIRLVDLGVYRLRDIPEAKRLFHAEYPGMAQQDFGPLVAEAGHKASLPPRFTRFFGREQEIKKLQEMLASPDARLITVTGPGGNGKTRLSLEVAEQLVEAFVGSVHFVALADLADPGRIAGAIADSLGIPRSSRQEPLEQAVEVLAKKPTLLVLDNFEQLVDGGGTEVVQTLLSRVPTLTLLVTSRQLLGLSGEREFALLPFPTPSGNETLENLSLNEGVQLFIDRAQQVIPYFQINNANAAAVAGLIEGLEGIPLAIELAAARVQVLTPAQMLAQLSHRFDFLATRKRDAPERQRTLRAAVEWSVRLLSPELQRFFARLSVFRGGWSVEAAETVCEEPLALDYLEQLRECSLVLPVDTGAAGTPRFRMLETLRQYGQERLAERKETDSVRDRHLAYFVAVANAARDQFQGPEQKTWLDLVEAEHDNLRAALAWSSSSEGADAIAFLRLVGALWRFWMVRGMAGEGRAWYAAAPSLEHRSRSADADTEYLQVRARALTGTGWLAREQGDYVQARSLAEESLAIGRDLEDRAVLAISLNFLGVVARSQGDYAQARTLLEESLDHHRAAGDRPGEAGNLTNLALVSQALGDYDRARALHSESLQIRREIQDLSGASGVLNNLALVERAQGNYAQARSLLEECLAIKREIGERAGVAGALGNLALLAQAQGDYAQTRALHEESLAISREIGHRESQAVSLANLGLVAQIQGDYDRARALFEETLQIRREVGDRRGIASTLSDLGTAARHQGYLEEARALYEKALALNREMGTRAYVAENLVSLGFLAQVQGDYAQARALSEEGLAIHREMGSRSGIARAQITLGEVALHEGDHDRARACLSESLRLLQELGNRLSGAAALEVFAGLARAQGDMTRAARLLGAAEALRNELGAPLPLRERDAMAREIADIRAALGEEVFAAAWEAGKAMGWEEAAENALE